MKYKDKEYVFTTDKIVCALEQIEVVIDTEGRQRKSYRNVHKYNVYIIGHSLDVTDKDVLKDIFYVMIR